MGQSVAAAQVERSYSNLGTLREKPPPRTGVVVCTIEKANNLVERMLEQGVLHETFSAVVIDELHFLSVRAPATVAAVRILGVQGISTF